jgi:cytochrome b6-f complex iron-sulfur subunit
VNQTMPPLVRRRLLALLGGPLAAAAAAAVGYPLLRYLQPAPGSLGAAEIEIPIRELAPGEARRVLLAGRPALVIRTAGGFRAFWASCTHLGCAVRWRRGRGDLFCPCHGGRFDASGRAVGGPVREPLVPLEVEVREETVVVRSA